jgi:dienelactone hydrolase
MNRAASLALSVVGLTLVAIIAGCGGSSNSVTSTPPPITVSVSASSTSVPAGGSASFTATVSQDTSGKGVTWTVTCSASQCGSVSPTSTASGSPTTYTPPSTPPPSDITITVKATSVADTSKSNSATIIFAAITVSVSPGTASVQAGNALPIGVTVNNDQSGQGVSWAISPASGAGSLSNVSNNGATYNAPATPPASPLTVTVTATSLADTTKSAVVTITVPSIKVSVTPTTASIPAGSTVSNLTAVVANDASHKGVTWSVSCSPAPCGSISPTTTASGAATVYTAPSTPPSADLPVTVTATSVADPTAATSVTITVLAISVSVTAPASTVQFADTVPNIVATVSNDPAGKGVTWSIQACGVSQCGTISPTATASGAAITYSAPPAPPQSDLTVAIVATSVSDTSKTNSVGITVLAITISLSPTSAIIPVNAAPKLNATPFTASVSNDTNNQGARWTLTQGTPPTACSPACGTLSSTVTTNAPNTYAAPATIPGIPANPSVTITATSVTDTTQTSSATITLAAGTVKLIPANLNFGSVKVRPGTHPQRTLTTTLTNTDSSALSITSQTTTSGPYSVTTPCPPSVASGKSCNIGVTFAPLTGGTFNSNLSIADSDVSSPQQVSLFGKACSSFRCFGQAIQAALVTDRIVTVPKPTGPNKVGTRVMDLVDSGRSDPYLANGDRRELLVRFWYPTALAQGCKSAAYTSSGAWNYMAQLVQVAPPQVQTNSCLDASITAGSHPVVVFTHGYTGTFTDYTFLFEDLASRGYVVASVSHTFETTAVQFPDGRLAKSVLGSHLGNRLQLDDPSTSLAVAVRLSDLKFVMDELGRLNASAASPFVGTLDMSRVALAGHSLGGLTALLGVELEPRFRAAVTMDGVMPGTLFSPTQTATLMMIAGSDSWDEKACHVWNALHGPRFAMNLKGSEHLTPSDAVWLTNGAIKTSGGMEKTVAAVRNYIAAFLDVNLNGKPMDRLLVGASSDYPDVEITTQNQTPCGEAQNDLQK